MDIVRTDDMPWENGLDVIASMEPAWRDNLGPAEKLADCYAKYNQKRLVSHPDTSYRGDLVYLEAGYTDLTDAYHDSVEECLYLTGDCTLSGEGDFAGGDYFWRPPGFIHAATSKEGFTALLFVEGENPKEGSGRASRVIRPSELAGTNGIHDDLERAVGPRGRVRVRTRDLPWIAGSVWGRYQGELAGFGLDKVEVKVLSHNAASGGQTILLRLAPGYAQHGSGRHTEEFGCFVISGGLRIGDEVVGANTWVSTGPGEAHPAWSSPDGATLFCKIPGSLDFISESDAAAA